VIEILHEYFLMEFFLFYKENGIIYQTSAPYTPQQNGLIKKKRIEA